MADREPVISLNEVVKSFDGRVVLAGVTFDVFPGETVVIMGGSGCGKSTLLRMIVGNVRADSGSIHMLGEDVTGATDEALNELRRKFGVLFQSGALFNSMDIAQNVALPLREHSTLDPATIDIMVKIKLELVNLREHADKFPAQISGGMKKRAGLARALALDPRILFYDEPSAGLDPVTSAEIDQLMIDLSKKLGVTSVVVTHEMDSAFAIADRMVMLDKGRVLAVEDRSWFERLRDTDGELSEDEALIRQFLCGAAEGPITERKQTTSYTEDLLGETAEPLTDGPSVVATR
ncbi:MAG: ABC transporter ATP-binding protein [Planctomycetaceae bacterium]|nr:ABC transporter ATP-binding protein [Planctomycetaceae bacterium]